MKGYTRENPMFSLCGLNCGLCPMHLGGYCPGCGGGEGHQGCAVIRCSREHGGVEYCHQCGAFPCGRYGALMEFDSFVPHRHMVKDQERAREMGAAAYRAELDAKMEILQELLAGYNDGRRKSFYCTAVSLLALEDLQAMMDRLRTASGPDEPVKARTALAVQSLNDLGAARGVELKLRKKPKKE